MRACARACARARARACVCVVCWGWVVGRAAWPKTLWETPGRRAWARRCGKISGEEGLGGVGGLGGGFGVGDRRDCAHYIEGGRSRGGMKSV